MSTSETTNVLQRLRLRENQTFVILTILIAIVAGLSAVLFTLAIQAIQHTLFGLTPSVMRLILIPTVVSLFTGFLLAKFFPDARGSGVPQTKVAYQLNQGKISGRVAFGKFLTGALCVGSGHSMGREGPSVQIGAALASWIGRWFHLSPERARSLVPVGAAAALAAAFNTPVAAVLFTLEEIIGDMNAPLIGSAVVASVTAVVVERSILGDEVLFRVPAYHLAHPAELIGYAILGLVGGLISVVFCKGLLRLRALFLSMPAATIPFQPAIGGLAIGITLVFVPQVMGVGYKYVDQALNGGLVLRVMILLCCMKLFATIVSYSSGNAGGIFAPSLYLGAMAGGAVGLVVQKYAPFPTGGPGAYALVGMGTLFAGIIRAPMTSVVMIFELTQDYQILVPLMVANMISLAVSKHYQPVPVYHALLEQNRIFLPHPEPHSKRSVVRDVMTHGVMVVSQDTPVYQALKTMTESKSVVCLVEKDGEIVGLMTRQAAEHAQASTVADAMEREFAYLHPDDSLDAALNRFSGTPGILPVLSRIGRKLEGVVTPGSIMEFVQQQAASETQTSPSILPG